MTSSVVSKLVVAAALAAAIMIAAAGRAPRRPVPRTDLRSLVGGALLLYAVGLAAALTHRQTLAAIVFGSGIAVSSLAGWLSRGADSGEPPGGSERTHEPPPPDTGTGQEFDWESLERQFRRPSLPREREPVA